MELSQSKADQYLRVKKRCKNGLSTLTLNPKCEIEEVLLSDEHGDVFKLDLKRFAIELKMLTCGNRVHDVFTLARLDVNSREHKNPDNTRVGGTHVHIYREKFGDKFAYPLETLGMKYTENYADLVNQFLKFCNIQISKVAYHDNIPESNENNTR